MSKAIDCYTNALKANPKDAKIFSNRAACHMKLNDFDSAIKDCNSSIDLDPNFAKAYLRKANSLKSKGMIREATDAYNKVLELDANSTEARVGELHKLIQTFKVTI